MGFTPDYSQWLHTHCSSLFSLLVGHELDIDLLQSTMGSWSQAVLNSEWLNWWLLSDPARSMGSYLLCDWPTWMCTRGWLTGGTTYPEAGGGQHKPMEMGGEGEEEKKAWEEVSQASEGINMVWQADWDKHTHRALRAGCSAEHTQYTACFRTRGKREKIDKK